MLRAPLIWLRSEWPRIALALPAVCFCAATAQALYIALPDNDITSRAARVLIARMGSLSPMESAMDDPLHEIRDEELPAELQGIAQIQFGNSAQLENANSGASAAAHLSEAAGRMLASESAAQLSGDVFVTVNHAGVLAAPSLLPYSDGSSVVTVLAPDEALAAQLELLDHVAAEAKRKDLRGRAMIAGLLLLALIAAIVRFFRERLQRAKRRHRSRRRRSSRELRDALPADEQTPSADRRRRRRRRSKFAAN